MSLFGARLPSYEHIPGLLEMMQFKKLLLAFSSHLSEERVKTGAVEMLSLSLKEFSQQPVTAFLDQNWLEKRFGGQSSEEVKDQEKMLWSLLMILLKFNGQVGMSFRTG